MFEVLVLGKKLFFVLCDWMLVFFVNVLVCWKFLVRFVFLGLFIGFGIIVVFFWSLKGLFDLGIKVCGWVILLFGEIFLLLVGDFKWCFMIRKLEYMGYRKFLFLL